MLITKIDKQKDVYRGLGDVISLAALRNTYLQNQGDNISASKSRLAFHRLMGAFGWAQTVESYNRWEDIHAEQGRGEISEQTRNNFFSAYD